MICGCLTPASMYDNCQAVQAAALAAAASRYPAYLPLPVGRTHHIPYSGGAALHEPRMHVYGHLRVFLEVAQGITCW